jgi:hypothetical protein
MLHMRMLADPYLLGADRRRATRDGAVLRRPPARLLLAAAKEKVVLSICARDAAQVTNEQRTREVAVRRRLRQGAAGIRPGLASVAEGECVESFGLIA